MATAVSPFVKQLRRTLRVPMTLIWDRLRAHRCEPVAGWLAQHRNDMRAHLLPPYAPELNPVELIWGYAKANPLANFAPLELRRSRDADPIGHLRDRRRRVAAALLHSTLRAFFAPKIGHYLCSSQ